MSISSVTRRAAQVSQEATTRAEADGGAAAPDAGRPNQRRNGGVTLLLWALFWAISGACVGLWMHVPTAAAAAATGANHGHQPSPGHPSGRNKNHGWRYTPTKADEGSTFSRDEAWSRPRFSEPEPAAWWWMGGADSAPAVWQFMSTSGGWKPYDEVSDAAIKAAHARGDAEVTVVVAEGSWSTAVADANAKAGDDRFPGDCPKWGARGGCVKNASWMLKNCAATCTSIKQAEEDAAAVTVAAGEPTPARRHGRYRIVFAEKAQYALDRGNLKRDVRLSSPNTNTRWVDPQKPVAEGKAVVAMLIDRSGSMGYLTDKVVDGSNQFIDKQREYDEKAGATTDLLFSTFDNAYDRLHAGAQLASVGKITSSDIGARGTTALHDGIGQILQDTLKHVNSLREAPGKVTVFIMTDGHENSSRQWSSDEIKQAVTSLKEQHNWQFIFAGANMDAVVAGSRYGFERSESVTYAARGRNVETMMKSVSQSVNRYKSVPAGASRASLEAATAFTDEERALSLE